MIRVTENFRKIQDLLAKSAVKAGRAAADIRLLAASKRQLAEAVLEAAAAGQREFGENVVQEAISKIAEVGRDDLTWHFIGHLQTNKTKPVAENFAWVHAVDRLRIAERLSRHRPYYADDLNVCIQVNIDAEASKSGISAAELPALAQAVSELPRLRLRGLMCLPAPRDDVEAQRKPFQRLRELYDGLRASGLDVDTLSMGMSADYDAAIREGATIIRIGTALFGPRS